MQPTVEQVEDQVAALHAKRSAAMVQERIARDAAFLHSARHPILENIAGFPAMPLCLFHCNLLRMMRSPFMPPFETPTPPELAAFLWVINPNFTRHTSRAKRRFLKTCQIFTPPRRPFFNTRHSLARWEKRNGLALANFTKTVIAAREFIEESFNDKPPPVQPNGVSEPDYYSDFCSIAARLMRHYHGLRYEDIQFMPVKVVYQFLKEIQEHVSATNGQPALLWNGSDRFTDEVLALLNKRN